MSCALSFAEVDGQYVELLPARTVLGVLGGPSSGVAVNGESGTGHQQNIHDGGGCAHNWQDVDGGKATAGK